MTAATCSDYADRPVQLQPSAWLTGDQEPASAAWLAQIGESDEAIVGHLLAQCRHDEDARQYFLGRAGKCITAKPTR
jgi:hypothetical protein